jgi:hypothetical protein
MKTAVLLSAYIHVGYERTRYAAEALCVPPSEGMQ